MIVRPSRTDTPFRVRRSLGPCAERCTSAASTSYARRASNLGASFHADSDARPYIGFALYDPLPVGFSTGVGTRRRPVARSTALSVLSGTLDDWLYGALLPGSFALSERQVMAEADVTAGTEVWLEVADSCPSDRNKWSGRCR